MSSVKTGFIGLGLIGGSLAKAIRLFVPDCTIIAYDCDQNTLANAVREGTVDSVSSSIDSSFQGCDYIFLCAPVSVNTSYLPALKPYIGSDTILTDAGSVKTEIHRAVIENHLESSFIGGHPMAGSEKTGFSFSKAALFENAYYILTPEKAVSPDKISRYRSLVEQIHAMPLIMGCARHDEITAAVSHLPHIIASGLVNYVRRSDSPDGVMRQIAAGGFRDITRIASSSPDMWQQICLANHDSILKSLHSYTASLREIETLLEEGDSVKLREYFSEARDYRDSMPDRASGPIEKTFVLYCDLVDEAGGIATIATILATQNISIKNIGIIHNREFEEGVLRIEFYDGTSYDRGVASLERHHYTVYTR